MTRGELKAFGAATVILMGIVLIFMLPLLVLYLRGDIGW